MDRGDAEFKPALDRRSPEMPPALRGELASVGGHALRDPSDVRNKPAANHSGVIGAIHALLERAVRRLLPSCGPAIIRSNGHRKQEQAHKETDV
jgi:hypothetical protein